MTTTATAKTAQVAWNGAKDDPESITQYGITFPKGKWVAVPDLSDKPSDPNRNRMAKFASNPWFQVQGTEYEPPNAGGTLASTVASTKAPGATVRAPLTTFKVVQTSVPAAKGLTVKTGWIVVDDRGTASKDVYASEAEAQKVADAPNQVRSVS